MEQKTTDSINMVKDQILQELVGMLQQNRQKEEADNVFEMAAYIDSMEKKLDAVTGELVNIKNQLADMERRRERKSLREMISEAAAKLELKCGLLKQQFTEVKTGIREKAADNKSVDKNYLETDISPVITAGIRLEFQYGAEAFQVQQLEAVKEKTESSKSKNMSAEIGKSR